MGLVIYLVLWVVMPLRRPTDPATPEARARGA